MNAFERLHKLIIEHPGLDLNSWSGSSAITGSDSTMNNPRPRRGRRPTSRRIVRWQSPAAPRADRLKEGCRMDPQSTEPEVREDLILRIRREIEDGVYDTPERFQAALDRLADRLEAD